MDLREERGLSLDLDGQAWFVTAQILPLRTVVKEGYQQGGGKGRD